MLTVFRKLKALFLPSSEVELEGDNPRKAMEDDEDKTRPKRGDDEDKVNRGVRSEYWYDDIEETVKENRDDTVKNSKYLNRLDYRTAWIMRVITGLAIALISHAALQYLI